ncbi:hypothetical protein J2Y45_000121 [Dyadobacter sp. BE34]|uniref:DUF6364 family protein n=1 Tax=Dyadobacter sp. BE34 TaxID=2817772 RepID=UPI0028555A59|nr:DUF6364 family protein [Dyadobacter sp. BE34]MDR7194995.1 hypothetical protein [Dyadobacter sp. BE34]MDR7214460.1 hypothetical protein [Dyadobacter sp. BE31]
MNITIEEAVLAYIKSYAAARQMSVSQIIEDHLKSIARSAEQKRNILEVIDEMDAPIGINAGQDLVKAYHEARSEKYGS